MAFRFRCPACNDVLSAAEDVAGTAITCPGCQAVLEVPPPPRKAPARAAPKAAAAAPAEEDGDVAVADEAPIVLHRRPLPADDMDMTPMVDVTFLLLIFFMVTAAFSMQKSFPTPPPTQAKSTAPARKLQDYENDPDYVVLRIDSNSTFHLFASDFDKETPSRHELLVQVRVARQGNREGVVPTKMLIVAHGDSRHEQVIVGYDVAAAVGLEEVKIITVEEDL